MLSASQFPEGALNAEQKRSVSLLVMSNSFRPHGLQPARLLCLWDSPGKNTGVFLSAGDLPDPRIEPGSPPLQADSLPTELSGKPMVVLSVTNLIHFCFLPTLLLVC